ncbi:hypothetical protein MNV49_004678 [Pseudohyphozyma bogoriensis]|nr:hypothetical protein MNV49_004678 [Pseudohyphozyma bogoriensis]
MSRGAVSCESDVAAKVGAEILRQGGSAADAIIATTLVVGTICSYMSGISGGGFALVREKDGQYRSVEFRVAAPSEAKSSLFMNLDATIYGGLSVAVPGEIRGFERLHNLYGKLPWAKLFEPAIKIARDGFLADVTLVQTLKTYTKRGDPWGTTGAYDESESWILSSPDLSEWLAPGGKFLEVGATVYRKEFADTLEKIAVGGADAFYKGEVAQSMVDHCRKDGGVLSMKDLADYEVRENTPLSIDYRGRKVVSAPAPASGACLLVGLSVLSHFEPKGPNSGEDAHHLAEACHFAYGCRTELGDPAFMPGLVEKQNAFVAPSTGKAFYEQIDESKTQHPDFYNKTRKAVMEDHGTSHITVADADGLVISMTTTITCTWGSRLVTPGTGIVLNDGMSDFAVEGLANWTGYEPSPANYVAGGKRTLSSTCPFIIENEDGSFAHAGGAAGGSKIVSANIQQARNVLDYNMQPAEALAHPRLHDQLLPNVTLVEPSFPETAAAYLTERGHVVKPMPRAGTVACAVAYSKEAGWLAAGEPRVVDSGAEVV